MGCKLFLQGIFMFFICNANAQVNADLNIDELHQKWYFSNSKSDNNQIVMYSNFRRAEEEDFNSEITEYKFSKKNSVLYLKYSQAILPQPRRCPTPILMVKSSPPYSNKGIWKLFKEEGFYYLEFNHYSFKKGKENELIHTETFQIDSLNEDIMVLSKLYEK